MLFRSQDIASNALRLIQNSIICWNYLYFSDLIAKEKDPELQTKIINSLKNGSIIHWQHINFYGEYDFTEKLIEDEFDMEAIKADCIDIGKGMGLHLDTSLTPSNATWWNPVTASQSNQGTKLKQDLESYIKFHTVENLGSYGIDEITDFNIYYEARGNGVYSVYFLFA